MAKQAKVFNGSASASTSQSNVPVYTCCDYYGNSYIWYYTTQTNVGSTTVYTVPSGRTAKVEVTYFTYNRSAGSNNGSISVGTSAWNDNQYTYALTSSSAGTQNNTSSSSPNYLYFNNGYWVPRVFYLSAGQSISISGPPSQTGTTSITYNFSVVEEY